MRKKISREKIKEKALKDIADPALRNFMKDMWETEFAFGTKVSQQQRHHFESFVSFCKKIKDIKLCDIDWELLCCFVDENSYYGPQCMRLLHFLLTSHQYKGKYSDILYDIKDCFYLKKGSNSCWHRKYFIHDDIKYLVHHNSYSRRLFLIKTDNKFLFEILKDFCIHDQDNLYRHNEKRIDWFWTNISLIFGQYENSISKFEDFNYKVFHQVESYCIKFSPCPKIDLLRVYRLFAFIIETYGDEVKGLFKDADPIDYNILKRNDLAVRVIEGFKYIYYNPYNNVPETDKWILNINDFDRGTTKLKATTTVAYDFTKITSKFYRNLLKSYIWHETKANFATKHNQYFTLTEILNVLTDIKKEFGETEQCISIKDTFYIKMWIDNKYSVLSTKAWCMSSIRVFFESQQSEENVIIEPFALDYLIVFGRDKKRTNAHAIPEKEIELLNAVMKQHASESLLCSYYYIIFHILIQTELRVSQVCHLKTGCILPTISKNQFIITTSSKTSNGQEYEVVITDSVKKLLDTAEKLSLSIRKQCITDDNKKYLFLYRNIEKQITPVSTNGFRLYLTKCCNEAGIPRYTPSNIRDFHMTKAEEEILRKGYSDTELLTLSGHRHVDTTRNHYIEEQLTQIIEAMYGIVIGNVDIRGNIVNVIPDEVNDKKHRVEGECGNCGRNTCIDDTMISCLMCKDFYTTVEYLPKFREIIIKLDELIKGCKWEHDKEDLVNKKRLVAAYIVAIETKIVTEGE